MVGRFMAQIDQRLALAFAVTVRPPAGSNGFDPAAYDEALAEAFTFELTNWGYVGAFLREQAASEGQDLDAFISERLDEMRQTLQPMPPGSPNEAAFAAISAMLADLDRPGVLRFSLATTAPRALEELFDDVSAAETLESDRLKIGVTYTPLP